MVSILGLSYSLVRSFEDNLFSGNRKRERNNQENGGGLGCDFLLLTHSR
jgi:hypothetical protein